jgi:hypothetical protein
VLQTGSEHRPFSKQTARKSHRDARTLIAKYADGERPDVKHQLFDRESYKSISANIPSRSSSEYSGSEISEVGRCRRGRPRYQLVNRIHFGRGENRARQRGCGLTTVCSRGHDTQCAPPDPRSGAFVSKRRSPSAAPGICAVHATRIGDRSGSGDQYDARAFSERVVQGNRRIRIDHDFVCNVTRLELFLQCATFFLAADACESCVKKRYSPPGVS